MFDFNSFDPTAPENQMDSFAQLPAGWYTAVISKAEDKVSSSGSEMIALELEIIDGQYKGRKVFTNIIYKGSDKAIKMGKRFMAQICNAVSVPHPKGYQDIMRKPLMAKLSIRPETADFPASNDVKEFKAMSSPSASTPLTATTQKKPWEK